jgi:FMN-dependent NADH-azoreductase
MTILKIDSSITGENSVSRVLTRSIIDQLVTANPQAEVVERDLVNQPLDHLTLAAFADSQVLDEFLAADTVVVGAPMYNFNISSQLKSWIDRIAVAGKTFRYTESGPEGLAGDKRVIVAVSRGGFYEEGNSFEHVEAYLKPMFNFLGIEPEFVRADGIAVGPEQREASLNLAFGEVVRLAA